MLKDVIELQPWEDYKLRLRFEDCVTGVADMQELVEF